MAQEIAARVVNKERAQHGESGTASVSSINDISAGRRGGLRSHQCEMWRKANPRVSTRSRKPLSKAGKGPPPCRVDKLQVLGPSYVTLGGCEVGLQRLLLRRERLHIGVKAQFAQTQLATLRTGVSRARCIGIKECAAQTVATRVGEYQDATNMTNSGSARSDVVALFWSGSYFDRGRARFGWTACRRPARSSTTAWATERATLRASSCTASSRSSAS